jgi:hypothetical protein
MKIQFQVFWAIAPSSVVVLEADPSNKLHGTTVQKTMKSNINITYRPNVSTGYGPVVGVL